MTVTPFAAAARSIAIPRQRFTRTDAGGEPGPRGDLGPGEPLDEPPHERLAVGLGQRARPAPARADAGRVRAGGRLGRRPGRPRRIGSAAPSCAVAASGRSPRSSPRCASSPAAPRGRGVRRSPRWSATNISCTTSSASVRPHAGERDAVDDGRESPVERLERRRVPRSRAAQDGPEVGSVRTRGAAASRGRAAWGPSVARTRQLQRRRGASRPRARTAGSVVAGQDAAQVRLEEAAEPVERRLRRDALVGRRRLRVGRAARVRSAASTSARRWADAPRCDRRARARSGRGGVDREREERVDERARHHVEDAQALAREPAARPRARPSRAPRRRSSAATRGSSRTSDASPWRHRRSQRLGLAVPREVGRRRARRHG